MLVFLQRSGKQNSGSYLPAISAPDGSADTRHGAFWFESSESCCRWKVQNLSLETSPRSKAENMFSPLPPKKINRLIFVDLVQFIRFFLGFPRFGKWEGLGHQSSAGSCSGFVMWKDKKVAAPESNWRLCRLICWNPTLVYILSRDPYRFHAEICRDKIGCGSMREATRHPQDNSAPKNFCAVQKATRGMAHGFQHVLRSYIIFFIHNNLA